VIKEELLHIYEFLEKNHKTVK